MTEVSQQWKFEAFIKVAGLALALFGIWEYFGNQKMGRINDAKSQALEYIKEANGDRHQLALRTLFEFWLRNSEAARMISTTGQTKVGFQAFFVSAVQSEKNGNEVVFALRQVALFYDELNVCYTTSVCDRDITRNFFCPDAKGYIVTYSSILELIGALSGDRELGVGLASFARECNHRE